MRCKKCRGLMIREKFFESIGGDSFWGWKCIYCGEIIDKIIIFNRIKSRILRMRG